jgi:sarcosine oxidase, subunit gamma
MASSSIDIFDLSELPRSGFKGSGTLAAMQARGFKLGNQTNRAFRQDDGVLCLVLAATEVFLLGSLGGHSTRLAKLETSWQIGGEERAYLMPRRHTHAWFALEGNTVPEMLAKLCAVDFRPSVFSDLSIAQTSVARLNSIVLRADRENRPTYHLLADSTCLVYMLACLKDAAEEFGGRVKDAGTLPS